MQIVFEKKYQWTVVVSDLKCFYSIGETWKNCLEGATDFKEVKYLFTAHLSWYTLWPLFHNMIMVMSVKLHSTAGQILVLASVLHTENQNSYYLVWANGDGAQLLKDGAFKAFGDS